MEPLNLAISVDASGELLVDFIGRQPSSQELEQLMFQLAAKRSGTQPPVSEKDPLADRVPVPLIDNPHITRHQEWTGATILGFRHTAYGWLHFRLSPELQQNFFGDMAKLLDAQKKQPPNR